MITGVVILRSCRQRNRAFVKELIGSNEKGLSHLVAYGKRERQRECERQRVCVRERKRTGRSEETRRETA